MSARTSEEDAKSKGGLGRKLFTRGLGLLFVVTTVFTSVMARDQLDKYMQEKTERETAQYELSLRKVGLSPEEVLRDLKFNRNINGDGAKDYSVFVRNPNGTYSSPQLVLGYNP